jgi:2-polyprenyl-3-methyl-5-hydroxy-6-metoxy-1,4-benzoquinol methylase
MGAVLLEENPCPLGCGKGDEVILTGFDRINNLPGEFAVVRCRGCGLMRTNPRPTPENIGLYYPDNYGPYLNTKITINKSIDSHDPLWKQMLANVFQFNIFKLPAIEPGRFLEIGCASGSFMHKMALKGWEVEGIEFSPKAAENARSLGYPVHTGSVETAPEPRTPFHLVSGWHVFEHLQEPVLILQKLHRWTHPDAWLALSVPNVDCWEFNAFKDAWYSLHLPNHLYHYTPKTLSMVLERGGWKSVKVFPQRILIDLFGSAGYFLQDMGLKNKLMQNLVDFPVKARMMNCLLYPFAYILGLFGQTSRIIVWAQKIKGFRHPK